MWFVQSNFAVTFITHKSMSATQSSVPAKRAFSILLSTLIPTLCPHILYWMSNHWIFRPWKPQLKFWLCIGNTWFYTDLQVFTGRPTICTSISVPVAISCFPIEGTAWVLFQLVNRNTSDTKQIFASYFALFLSGHWRICDASRSSNSKFWAIKVKLNITSKSFKRPKWPETIEPPYRTLRTF